MAEEKDIFCKIIEKIVPSKIVDETDDLIVIHDIKPAANIHILIIPKKHGSLQNYNEDDAELLGKLLLKAHEMSRKLEIDKTGYRIVINYGEDGKADVKEHLHVHLLGGEDLGHIIKRY